MFVMEKSSGSKLIEYLSFLHGFCLQPILINLIYYHCWGYDVENNKMTTHHRVVFYGLFS